MTSGDELIRSFSDLQTWKRGSERAPHKPLLVLLALGRILRGESRLITFAVLEPNLARLLIDFGPPRASVHPEYPFWRLQRDGVWEVVSSEPLKSRRGNTDPLKSELLAVAVEGGFLPQIFDALKKRPEIIRSIARNLLEAHFPESLHSAISIAVGIDLGATCRNPLRDARFRDEVIAAWGHKCGFCGYDLKLDNSDLGLEAAHIRWVQAGGPDTLSNGIACCALHHLALDRGAIGIDKEMRILVSSRLHGNVSLNELFLRLRGRSLALPSIVSAVPRFEFISWHRAEVFRGEPRD